MNILLDENIDVRLKHRFPDTYDVYTVKDMQWNGIKNGELLLLLKENDFDTWIVVDKNIPYQQNINNLKHLLPLIPQVFETLILKENKIIVDLYNLKV